MPSATEPASATAGASKASPSAPETGHPIASKDNAGTNAAAVSASNTSSTTAATATPELPQNVTESLNAKASEAATTQSTASSTSSSSAPPESQRPLPENAAASPSVAPSASNPEGPQASTANAEGPQASTANAEEPQASTANAEKPQTTGANAEKTQASAAAANAEDDDDDELELVGVTKPELVRMTRRIDPVSGLVVPFFLAADPEDEEERRVKALRARIFEVLPQLKTIDGVDRAGLVFDFNDEAANECVTLSSGEDSEGSYCFCYVHSLRVYAVVVVV